jgi:Holliday junction DNA helicase RuvA
MISYLKGTILEKGLTYIILYTGGTSASGGENNGVGYKVFVTPATLQIPAGYSVALYTHMKVSDDGQSLFGLPDFATLQFFELLITVSGVGPKVALAILSAAKVEAVRQAIANQDAGVFTRISGIGLKTAEKIIVELKSKVGPGNGAAGAGSEVFDALLALGYNQREVREVVGKINSSLPEKDQLKEALKLLGKH